eukprot:1154968-Pelagomonas_calceolata.AAC.9
MPPTHLLYRVTHVQAGIQAQGTHLALGKNKRSQHVKDGHSAFNRGTSVMSSLGMCTGCSAMSVRQTQRRHRGGTHNGQPSRTAYHRAN